MGIDFPVAVLPAKPLATSALASVIGVDEDGGLKRGGKPVANIKDFGAKGDGSDATTAFKAAALLGEGVIVPEGLYVISEYITGADYTRFFGIGRAVLKAAPAMTVGSYHSMFEMVSKTGFSFEGLEFDSSELAVFPSGYREIIAYHCTNYLINDNTFVSAGAAVASLGSSDYAVTNNTITIDPFDGAAKHDGIIDNWEGSNNFLIAGNVIHGAGIGRYGILATGQATDTTAAACYDFVISNNRVEDMLLLGIWINGRNGVNYSFSVKDNIVADVATAQGIRVEDVYDFTVTSNKIRNIGAQGIIIGKEGTYGTYGARDGIIADNIVRDVNLTSGVTESGWAISSSHADNSRLTFKNNKVRGSLQTYAMGIRGSAIKLIGKDFDAGTSGTVISSGTLVEQGYLEYAPTVTGLSNVSAASLLNGRYKFEDGYVTLSVKVSVTPTAAASTVTTVSVTLPIPSNFTNTGDCIGVANSGFGVNGGVSADVTNDYMVLTFPATNTSANSIGFLATYRVL